MFSRSSSSSTRPRRSRTAATSCDRKAAALQQRLSENKQALDVARGNLATAQRALAQRLALIYTSQDSQSSLAVVLGAQSLDDLVTRLETLNTVTTQNSSLISRSPHTSARSSATSSSCKARSAPPPPRPRARRAKQRSARSSPRSSASTTPSAPRSRSSKRRSARASSPRRGGPKLAARVQRTQLDLGGDFVGGNLPTGRYSAAVGIAEQYLGVPYVWGGASPSGFDCSGLVMYVYAQLGVSLPHYTVSQYNYPNAVHPSRSELQPGDLVFFAGLGHVGIYIGGNQFIHAPHTGRSCRSTVSRAGTRPSTTARPASSASAVRGLPRIAVRVSAGIGCAVVCAAVVVLAATGAFTVGTKHAALPIGGEKKGATAGRLGLPSGTSASRTSGWRESERFRLLGTRDVRCTRRSASSCRTTRARSRAMRSRFTRHGRTSSLAISFLSTDSATSGSTSAATSSSTRRTPGPS